MDDSFTAAVKFVVPWITSLILFLAAASFLIRWQDCERQAISRGFATYDESGVFVWKEKQ